MAFLAKEEATFDIDTASSRGPWNVGGGVTFSFTRLLVIGKATDKKGIPILTSGQVFKRFLNGKICIGLMI